MTEKITFRESAVSDQRRRSLREHLGPTGFTITLATIVLAFLALGAGVSLVVNMLRRPPIVTTTHGAASQAVLAPTAPRQ